MTDDDFDWYLDNIVVPGRQAATRTTTQAQVRQRRWRTAADLAASDPVAHDAVEFARQHGLVLTREQALSVGLRAADVRRLVRRGTWTAPRRNVLCVLEKPKPSPQPGPVADDPDEQPHGLRPEVLATAAAIVRPASVVSHESAAAIHAIPLLRNPARPILTVGFGNGGGERDVLVHAARLTPDEEQLWFGARVTTVARTVVDISRNSGARAGLVAADAALHDRLVTREQLDLAVRRAARWPGVTIARRIVELASNLAESPLESLSRLLIIDAGLPVPQLQTWVWTSRGRFRVDGLWPERGVVLEADGMRKYREEGSFPAEKLRQEALERAGYVVVRVMWADVWNAQWATVDRIADALRRGGRLRTLGVG